MSASFDREGIMRARSFVIVAFAAAVLPSAARAAELIVVEARGIAMHQGDTIDDQKTLTLKEGQHLTLVAPNGATLKFDGPYDAAPGKAQGDGSNYGTALRALVTAGVARAEAGVTRTGVPRVILPEPWLLNVSRNGTVCLKRGERPLLWRENSARAAKLTIIANDRTWQAAADWPAGSDRLVVPGDLPVDFGKTYHVRLDDAEAAITVKIVPPQLASGEMQAAWLADVGCEPQAEALFKTLK